MSGPFWFHHDAIVYCLKRGYRWARIRWSDDPRGWVIDIPEEDKA
jgi:hypothetical protein